MACFVFHGQSLHKEVIIGKLLRIHYFSPFLDLAIELAEKGKMRKDHQICIVGQYGKNEMRRKAKAHSGSCSKATYPNLPLPPSSLSHPLDDDLFHEG